MVYSQAEGVCVLNITSAQKSLDAVRQAFSSAYPGNQEPNKTTIHQLVKIFQDTQEVLVCDTRIGRSDWCRLQELSIAPGSDGGGGGGGRWV
jgi:hypothetical protein